MLCSSLAMDSDSQFIYNPNTAPDDAVSGILEIHAHHATNIHNICIYDNQDVYAKFSLTSDPDHTISTRIIHGGGKNPQFNEDLVMEINQLDGAILKCEIWMMSRAKNYMDDQLLGFALIPISLIVSGKGKITQDFDLSSTDLFHSPAGTIKLSLLLNSNASIIDTADSDSSTTSVFLVDKNIPEEYSRIEFPDINQQIVSEVFAKNEAILRLWMDDKPDASFLHLGSTPPTSQDYDMATCNSSDESSSMVENSIIDEKEKQQPNVLKTEVEEKALPVGLVIEAAEESAMQRQIVDMYMKSMQQFTESLAKMKLPLDLDKPGAVGDLIIEDHDQIEKKNKKDNSSRVFYGSRAFF